jgi:hypothetical protein
MKVIATDCSPAADLVLAEATARPWPKDTSFSLINVVDLHRFAGLWRCSKKVKQNWRR